MIHKRFWTNTSDESTQTKASIRSARPTNKPFTIIFPAALKRNVLSAATATKTRSRGHGRTGRLRVEGIAKQHAFQFTEIFSVWIQRELAGEQLKKLVFITPEAGAKRLTRASQRSR
jgi:hypothetical protein